MGKGCPPGYRMKSGRCVKVIELTADEVEALVDSIDDDLTENEPETKNILRNILIHKFDVNPHGHRWAPEYDTEDDD